MEGTKILETKKDYYLLMVKGITIGELEKSQLRHLIETIDNAI